MFRIILTCCMFWVFIVATTTPTCAANNKSEGEVVSIQGTAQIRAEKIKKWELAVAHQAVFAGDYLRTASYSRMGILFRDRTQIRLHENTIIQIKAIQSTTHKVDKTVLRLNRGRAWSQTKTIPRGLLMETPSATAAIRGTDWELEVDENGQSTLTVFSGEIDFFNEFGHVSVKKNEQAKAEVGKAPSKIIIVSPKDRVQWVTAYAVDPLRHIYLYSDSMDILRKNQVEVKGSHHIDHANILFDLGNWQESEKHFQAALDMQSNNGHALLGLGFTALKAGDYQKATHYFSRAELAIAAIDRELLKLGQIAVSIQSENIGKAINSLKVLIQKGGLQQPAPYLLLSDIMIYNGEINHAIEYARAGLEYFPNNASLLSQLSRINLFADRMSEAREQVKIALKQDAHSYEALLALGDLAKVEGDAFGAEHHYANASKIKPHDDRAWYGQGVVNTEKENIKAGREYLNKAISLNPNGPGYYGELATLETFANHFAKAEGSFQKALEINPNDFVALTGLGLLELKRGNAEEALDAFLRAGLIEPKYARVHMYTAVAYYHLGYIKQALNELQRANELDEKDPLPHLLSSMIYDDLFQPRKAMVEGRKAMRLMPYLKSLNQVAIDQRGTANLGRSFALFGLEEWAQNHAQESYNPFWAGSHLFLADRYSGEFNKESELFQGFITDPTIFGMSNRFQTLLPKPGSYLSTGYRVGQDSGQRVYQEYLEVNGLSNSIVPIAYYLNTSPLRIYSRPDGSSPTKTSDSFHPFIGALGAKPTDELSVFAYGSSQRINSSFGGSLFGTTFDFPNIKSNRDILSGGINYKFSPTSQLWLKVGKYKYNESIATGVLDANTIDFINHKVNDDFALRYSFMTDARHEISWGAEQARQKANSDFTLHSIFPFFFLNFNRSTVTTQLRENKSWDAYVSGKFELSSKLLMQADVFYQQHNRSANEEVVDTIFTAPIFGINAVNVLSKTSESFLYSGISPRLGFVYKFEDNNLVRFAYQNWVRPVSSSTLSPVATAGIPLDDQLVSSGGELTRYRGQVEWEWTDQTFISAYIDYKKIQNNLFNLTEVTYSPSVLGLKDLQPRDFASLARDSMLERTPVFKSGKDKSLGLAINQILSDEWAGFARYAYHSSENTSALNKGNKIPYLPRHTGVLGVTWVSPMHTYFIAKATYRTERFKDAANTSLLHSSTDVSMDAFWESTDKRWLIRLGVDNLVNAAIPTFLSADINVRF